MKREGSFNITNIYGAQSLCFRFVTCLRVTLSYGDHCDTRWQCLMEIRVTLPFYGKLADVVDSMAGHRTWN